MSGPDPAGDDTVDQAVANAALEGIEIPVDEQELIRLRHTGRISHEEFLARARRLAVDKSEQAE